LVDVDAFGSAAEVKFLCDSHEVAKMSQLDQRHILSQSSLYKVQSKKFTQL